MQADEFAVAVSSLLRQFGDELTESIVRRQTADCRNDIYADAIAHGGRIEDPFFNFVLLDGVAVFTFFESQFSIYVVRCDETELISQTNQFALADTVECKNYLADKYGKNEPDLIIPCDVCEHWLGPS